MEKVNARVPEAERFESLFWAPWKRIQLNKEYRRLFPDGDDLKQMRRLTIIAFSAVAVYFLTMKITQGL